ncbi:aminotransferase class IV [Lacrimispora sp. JR3]|uniref:aminotransferase class IV n=1 Tax=Lacrimispora sinapis TaxID=3111456 RepID=UPI0037490967
MKELAYYDGTIGTPEEVTVPFNDRVHFFGDGVYDASVGGNHQVYLLEEHLDRFYSSANALGIIIPMEKDKFGRLLTELLSKVEGNTHFVYWQVTRGAGARNHVYGEEMRGKLWVMIRPNLLKDPNAPIKLITMEDTRFFHCNIKTLNLIPSVMAAQKARKEGADETVFHRGDMVTECAHSNVSILKDGIFYSHPNDNYILRGISKTHMIKACYRLGIPVIERPFSVSELMEADEILVTSSSNFCLHANAVNGRTVGGKDPVTLKKLQDEVIREYLNYTGKESLFD